VLLEYVSANPTGPVGVVQGRAGALGDVLANLLEWTGHEVSREYYVNDALNSRQVQKFAETVEAWYLRKLGREAELPEDGYEGEYVAEMAEEVVREAGERYLGMPEEERREEFRRLALERIVAGQRADLEAYGVRFDRWFWESSLYESGEVEQVIRQLEEGGHTYEAEGALWLKATAFGHHQDEVLVRSNEAPTYLAADAAYHRNKFERGYDKLIDIWGPDHHGHVSRTRAAVEALGYEPGRLEILLHQVVRLFSGGEMVRMSKRAGEIIPLRDLIEEVGADAARFFFLMRSAESHLDFDLELAKKQAPENPVYYVQYAHARICSILREAEERGVSPPGEGAAAQADLSRLTEKDELALMRKLAELPEEIGLAAREYEPHRLTRYSQELAASFHQFYTTCRVLSDDAALTAARLQLVKAARHGLRVGLKLLGISAPERM
jgi:arginyl-tRNA synthetase